MTFIWHNGTFKDADAPLFTAQDRIRLGDGVFDTLLVVDGKAVHAALHFDRLLKHAGILGIEIEENTDFFEETLGAVLQKNALKNGRYAVNTIITRGPAGRGLALPETTEPQIVMRITPAPDTFEPVNAVIAESIRRNEYSPLSRLKSLNYGDNILALREAAAKNANEALILNTKGHIACASAGNFFIAKDQKLYTPPLTDGVLDGIIRKILIKKYNAAEESLTLNDLENASALYITNAIRGVMPVTQLNGKDLPPPSLQIDKDIHLK